MARIRGTAGKDQLFGNSGADQLFGLAGNDTLDGRAGIDRYSGGTGNDVFKWHAGSGHDTIADFENGHDRVAIHGFDFNGNFDAFLALFHQVGTDVVGRIGSDILTFHDTRLAELDRGDFFNDHH